MKLHPLPMPVPTPFPFPLLPPSPSSLSPPSPPFPRHTKVCMVIFVLYNQSRSIFNDALCREPTVATSKSPITWTRVQILIGRSEGTLPLSLVPRLESLGMRLSPTSLVPRPHPKVWKRAWCHLQEFPYVLCQQSLLGVEESRFSITNY